MCLPLEDEFYTICLPIFEFAGLDSGMASDKSRYTSIPTSSSGDTPPSSSFLQQMKERGDAMLATCMPWSVFTDLHSFNVPKGISDAYSRFMFNLSYFRVNYSLIVLTIVFLSLLWHPISMIVFIIMFAGWLFLYFNRESPLMIFGREVNDRIVLLVLSIVTLVALLLTQATTNITVSFSIGLAIVVLHGVFRITDDLYVLEDQAGARLTPGV